MTKTLSFAAAEAARVIVPRPGSLVAFGFDR